LVLASAAPSGLGQTKSGQGTRPLDAAIKDNSTGSEEKKAEVSQPRRSRTIFYKSFKGSEMKLNAWEGLHVVVLTPRSDLKLETMSDITSALDRIYEFYHASTGREPAGNPQTTINKRSTIAVVEDSCPGAAGCGYLGATGIELLPTHFDELYELMEKEGKFTTLLPYEFGRNFWFYGQQIEYLGPDNTGCITTGYAVFMRFMAIEGAALKGGPWNSHPFTEFVRGVEGLVDRYEADTSLSWTNTLRVHKAPNNPLDLNGTDLLASFLFRLRRDYGGNEFVKKLWAEVPARPTTESTQDAVDNFVVAASRAASRDLVPLFREQWRWPVSEEAAAEIRTGRASVKKVNEALLERYGYDGGYFGKRAKPGPRQWKEGKTDSTTAFYFEELVRDEQFIFLKDADRGFTVRIPVRGGESKISSDNGTTWRKLYDLRKE
jgi:hypothetical protein